MTLCDACVSTIINLTLSALFLARDLLWFTFFFFLFLFYTHVSLSRFRPHRASCSCAAR